MQTCKYIIHTYFIYILCVYIDNNDFVHYYFSHSFLKKTKETKSFEKYSSPKIIIILNEFKWSQKCKRVLCL